MQINYLALLIKKGEETMGLMNWLMKGVEQKEQHDVKSTTFDNDTIERLKNISNSEMQESTTINKRATLQTPNYSYNNAGYTQGNMVPPMQNNAGFATPFAQNVQYGAVSPMMQPVGMQPVGYQNVLLQTAPNTPYVPTTITLFKIANEDDIKFTLKHLGKKSPCLINFVKMPKKAKLALKQFLNGGVFALGATMMKRTEDEYLLTPRGMEISVQDRSKKNG